MHYSSCTIACGLHRQGDFQAADRRALSSRNLSTMQSSSPIVFLVRRCGNASKTSVLFLLSLVSRRSKPPIFHFFFRLFLRLSPERRLTSSLLAYSHVRVPVGFETCFSSPWRRLVARSWSTTWLLQWSHPRGRCKPRRWRTCGRTASSGRP